MMSARSINWKAIGWLSLGLALFFALTAAGQYLFVQSQIQASVEKQLQRDADKVAGNIVGIANSDGKLNLAFYNKVLLSASNYIVLSSDGVILQVTTSSKDGFIPGLIPEVVAPSSEYFVKPNQYVAPTGERWTLFSKNLQGGYVVVGMSNASELVRGETPEETLTKNIAYFTSKGGQISVDANQIDNPVDYAIVDATGVLQASSGRLPLKTNLAAVNRSVRSVLELPPEFRLPTVCG